MQIHVHRPRARSQPVRPDDNLLGGQGHHGARRRAALQFSVVPPATLGGKRGSLVASGVVWGDGDVRTQHQARLLAQARVVGVWRGHESRRRRPRTGPDQLHPVRVPGGPRLDDGQALEVLLEPPVPPEQRGVPLCVEDRDGPVAARVARPAAGEVLDPVTGRDLVAPAQLVEEGQVRQGRRLGREEPGPAALAQVSFEQGLEDVWVSRREAGGRAMPRYLRNAGHSLADSAAAWPPACPGRARGR